MKKASFRAIALVLSFLASGMSSSLAVLTNYEYAWRYVPNPSNPSIGNFQSTPPANFTGNQNSSNNKGVSAITNYDQQTLTINIPMGNIRTWLLGYGAANEASPKYAQNGPGTMIEVKAKVNSQSDGADFSMMLAISGPNPGRSYNFVLGDGVVGFAANFAGDNYSTPMTVNFDTVSDFNVYQIYATYDSASLFINGALVLSDVPVAPAGGHGNRLELGVFQWTVVDDVNTAKVGGEVTYEYIARSNNVPIPEPSTCGFLMLTSLGLLTACRNRRQRLHF
jgi:hypothetical protein